MQHADSKEKTTGHDTLKNKPVTRAELKAESKVEQQSTPPKTAVTTQHDGQTAGSIEKDLKPNDPAGLQTQNQLSQVIGDSQVTLYCICRTADEQNMICCDKCEEWYHFHCIGI